MKLVTFLEIAKLRSECQGVENGGRESSALLWLVFAARSVISTKLEVFHTSIGESNRNAMKPDSGSEDEGEESVKVLWSGLETKGMMDAKCSLLLPPDIKLRPTIKSLPPERLHIHRDEAWDSSDNNSSNSSKRVDFGGCTVMQLEWKEHNTPPNIMPVTLTVGGRCHLTAENYKNFVVMMRTKDQSRRMNILENGRFEWPDVESVFLCPICHVSAGIPVEEKDESLSRPEYWMLFYPLLQFVVLKDSKMALGTRTICRLTCKECLEKHLRGKKIKMKKTIAISKGGKDQQITKSSTLSAMDILHVVGSVSFLQDNPPRPDSHANVDDVMDAWTLYNLWEQSGAWEALQLDYRNMLSRSVSGKELKNETPQQSSSPDRLGLQCHNPGCNRIHGKYDKRLGLVVRLSMACQDCHVARYCSHRCRAAASKSHKASCRRPKEIKDDTAHEQEEREGAIRKVTCNYCKKRRPYTEMKKCSRCRLVIYCSVDCQTQGWVFHKSLCVKRK